MSQRAEDQSTGFRGRMSASEVFASLNEERGSDPRTDEALAKHESITRFLRQGPGEVSTLAETRKRLLALL